MFDEVGARHGLAYALTDGGRVDFGDDVGLQAAGEDFLDQVGVLLDANAVGEAFRVAFAEIHMGEHVEDAGSVAVQAFAGLHGLEDAFEVPAGDVGGVAVVPDFADVDGVAMTPMDADQDKVEGVVVEKVDDFVEVVGLKADFDALADEDGIAEFSAEVVDGPGVGFVVVDAGVAFGGVGVEVFGEGEACEAGVEGSADVFFGVSVGIH